MTRSEETYKMLGYLEKFRNSYDANEFHCVLLMSSKKLIYNKLISERRDKLTLIGVTENTADRKYIEDYFDHAIGSWLA